MNQSKEQPIKGWVKASERLPTIDAKYFCRHLQTGVRMFIWLKDIYSGLEWLDETVKSFLPVLEENYQAQIAGYYNYDKTDIEKEKRNAVIEEYEDLIAIYKNGYMPTPIAEGEERWNKDKEIDLLEAREVAWANRVSQLNEEIAERNKMIFDLCDQMDGHLKEIERLKKEIEDKAIYTGNSLK